MRQRLLALAALVSAAGAGTVLFAQWNAGSIDAAPELPGGWELVDRQSCTTAVCNAPRCIEANNVLADAGRGNCDTRLVACDVRLGARARALAEDAGDAPGPRKYQRVRFVALRCPAADGGSAWAIPVTDAGYPAWGTAVVTPRCVRAPADGGTLCQRSERDGGYRYFGTGNVIEPASESNGHATCEPCGCRVMAGDSDEEL